MNELKDPEAAETVQTERIKAVNLAAICSPVRGWSGRSIQEILDADTGDSSLIHNLANRGRELEAENARMRKSLNEALPWIERTYGAMEKQKPVLVEEIQAAIAIPPHASQFYGPVMFDHRAWNNWDGAELEAVLLLNHMLRFSGLRIEVEWIRGDDYTTVSIVANNPLSRSPR